MITEGVHRAVCQSIQFGHAGKDNKEQIVVEFKLVGETDPDAGYSISWFGFFTEATFHRTIESLRYCGWTGDDLEALPEIAAIGMLAEEVDIVVAHEEYEGKITAKVQWVNRPGGGKIKLAKPMEAADLKSFAARMKASIRAVDSSPAPRKNSTGGTQRQPSNSTGSYRKSGGGHAFDSNIPPVGADDDVPF